MSFLKGMGMTVLVILAVIGAVTVFFFVACAVTMAQVR